MNQTVAAEHSVRSSTRIALGEAIALPTGLITAALLTRTLGPADYGLLSLAAIAIATIEWTLATLLARATIRIVASSDTPRKAGEELLRLHVLLGLVCAAIPFLYAKSIAALLSEPALRVFLQVASLEVLIFATVEGYRCVLIATGEFQARATAAAVRWIVRLILIYLLVSQGYGVIGAILGGIGGFLAELALVSWHSRLKPWSGLSLPSTSLLAIVGPLVISSLCLRLLDRADLFLVKALGGTAAQTGMYGAALNLTMPIMIISIAVSPVLLSVMTQHYRQLQFDQARGQALTYVRLSLLLLPLVAIVAGSASAIMELIFGHSFHSAGPILGILMIAAAGSLIVSLEIAALIAAGKPAWTYWIAVPMLLGGVTLQAVLMLRFGWIGAAAGAALTQWAGAVAAALAAHHVIGPTIPLKEAIRNVAVAVALGCCSAAIPSRGAWLFLECGGLTVALAVLLYAFRTFRTQEWPMLLAIVKNRPPEGIPESV